MGAPTKLTPELETALLDAIRKGYSFRAACRKVGIDRSSLENWREWGGKGRPPYAAFFRHLKSALVESEQALAESIHDAGYEAGEFKRQWQAHAWLLERRWPKRWGRKDKLALEGRVDVAFAERVSKMTPEEKLAECVRTRAALDAEIAVLQAQLGRPAR